jgi:hypothetical protein
MKIFVSLLITVVSSLALAAPVCSNQVLSADVNLDPVCEGRWACYQNLMTTCTHDDGRVEQFTQVVFVSCVTSMQECR